MNVFPGKAAHLLGLIRRGFLALMARKGIPQIRLEPEEWDAEVGRQFALSGLPYSKLRIRIISSRIIEIILEEPHWRVMAMWRLDLESVDHDLAAWTA